MFRRNAVTRDRFKGGRARPRHMDVTPGALQGPDVPGTPAESEERIVHPVIRSSGRKRYRVVRVVKVGTFSFIEDIGEFATATPAYAMARREHWFARILDPQGKIISVNHQPIEVREE